jgi:uncharacterized protein YdhG (YjbR/CyaY superfamily)
MNDKKPQTIDTYIQTFPADVQAILQKVRRIVHKVAPEAGESIAYGIPAFKLSGKPIVYVGGWQHHIGFYATPAGNLAFKKELAPYQGAKGSVQFPLNQPIPYDLIEKIVRFRVAELTHNS